MRTEAFDQEFDERMHTQRRQPALRHHRVDAGSGDTPARQHLHEPPCAQILVHMPGAVQRDAEAGDGCIAQHFAEIRLETAADAHGDLASAGVAHAPEILPALAADENDAFVPSQLLRRGRHAMPVDIGRCRAKHAVVHRDLASDEVRIDQRTDADREVVAGADEVLHLVAEIDADAHARIAREEFRQQRREVLAAERGRHGHAQGARHLAAALAHVGRQCFQILDQRAPAFGQGRAFGRRVQPPRGPVQQAHAEFALQALETLAGDGDRDIEVARGCADRALIEHAQEQHEVADAVHYYQ